MPASKTDKPSFMTLSELAGLVKRAVESLEGDIWVVAELAELNVNRYSGHCYMGLVEKKGETTVAQMKATIWAGVYKRLSSVFKKATGSDLRAGMKVLMRGSLNFHEVYGLSLNVREVDPAYTLGEMALKRRETLERLTKEGLIDLNRAIPFPVVPQRVAVIASETSAGYGDFIHRTTGNPYGYSFTIGLFPAYMQGERAEGSIIKALAEVKDRAEEYDVAVLIRGGGSQVDLSCFDSYTLAAEIARFPLPVLSGIGHERDETVTDRVANMRLITPSAVAEALVSRMRKFEDRVEDMRERLVTEVTALVGQERHRLAMAGRGLLTSTRALVAGSLHRLSASASAFSAGVRGALSRATTDIADMAGTLRGGARLVLTMAGRAVDADEDRLRRAPLTALESVGRRIEAMETKARLLDPAGVLRRGYSITLHEGRALKQASDVKAGSRLRTLLSIGEITSIVEDIKEDGDA